LAVWARKFLCRTGIRFLAVFYATLLRLGSVVKPYSFYFRTSDLLNWDGVNTIILVYAGGNHRRNTALDKGNGQEAETLTARKVAARQKRSPIVKSARVTKFL